MTSRIVGKLPTCSMARNFAVEESSAVTDPSDWSVEGLQDMDRLLRCPICFEYFQTPMILPCSHSYCSLCVRRYLRVKGDCPSCHKPVNDSQLIRNLSLEDILKSFCQNRAVLVQMSKAAYPTTSSPSKPAATTTSGASGDQRQPALTRREQKSTTSPSQRRQKKRLFPTEAKKQDQAEESVAVSVHTAQKEPVLENDSKVEKEKVAVVDKRKAEGNEDSRCLVPSPPTLLAFVDEEISFSPSLLSPHSSPCSTNHNCSQDTCSDIQLAQNKFRDSSSDCESPPTPIVTPIKFNMAPIKIENSRVQINATQSSSGPSTSYFDVPRVDCPVCGLHVKEDYINVHLDMCLGRTPARSAGSPAHRLPRLPKLCFNIMKDRELKRKLKEYHLTPTGSRQVMISRLKEFTLQYNAQYDSSNPKSIAQIAAEVEEMEGLLNRPVKRSSVTMKLNRSSTEEDISREQELYVEAHKDHFAKLLDGVQTTSNSSTLLPAVKSEPPDFDFVETRATEIPLSCSVKVEKSTPPAPVTTPTSHVTPSRNSSKRRQDKASKRRREADGAKSDSEYCPENSPPKRRTRKKIE